MRRLAAAVLFVLLGLATGCANAGSGSAGGTSGPSGPPTPISSTATPAPGPTESGSITVDGIVERGVEPGCLVLRAGARSYLLVQGGGGSSASGVPVAVPVRVSGQVLTGIASYCQQGTPLEVSTVTRR